MGLLEQAKTVSPMTQRSVVSAKKKSSLLLKICTSNSYDRLVFGFRSFLSAIPCERGGILFPSIDNMYCMLVGTGFDLTTIHRFCPDIQSLDREIEKDNSWNTFTDSRLSFFRPFFSSRENDSLISISLYPIQTANQTWYILLVQSMLDIERGQIDLLHDIPPVTDFIAVVKENLQLIEILTQNETIQHSSESEMCKLKSELDTGKTATIIQVDFSLLFTDEDSLYTENDKLCLYNAILHELVRKVGPSTIVRLRRQRNVIIVLFSAIALDTSLYFYQLKSSLEELFGTYRIAKLSFKHLLYTRSVSETADVLYREN